MLEELENAIKTVEKCCKKRNLTAYATDVSKGEVDLVCANCRTKHTYFRKEGKVNKSDAVSDEKIYEEISNRPLFLKDSKDWCPAHFNYFIKKSKLDKTKLKTILR